MATFDDSSVTLDVVNDAVAQLNTDVSRIRQMLESGNALATPPPQAATAEPADVADRLRALDAMNTAADIAALGSPVRLEILTLCADGPIKVRDLADQLGKGTTGQVYHHLRQLSVAGWLRPAGKSAYAINEDRIDALSAILDAVS